MTELNSATRSIEAALKFINSASAMIGMLPENPGYNGTVLLIDDEEAARIVRELDEAAAIIVALTEPVSEDEAESALGWTPARCDVPREDMRDALQKFLARRLGGSK